MDNQQLVKDLDNIMNLLEAIIVKVEADINNPTLVQPAPSSSNLLSPDAVLYGLSRASWDTISKHLEGRNIATVGKFIYDEAIKLDIDPVFAIAEAILETGWGDSLAAKDDHNWYGYMEFTDNSRKLRHFNSDAEGISTALNDMRTNYFEPNGEFFFNGNGRTLSTWATHWIAPSNLSGTLNVLINIMQTLES